MLNKNIETFLGCEAAYQDARIVLFGAPFDSTTSYRPGTRFASRTMRAESYGLETYSPYLDLDMEDASVFDGGDLELCFGDTEKALGDIERFTREVLADNKLPLMLGGEHLVTLGALRSMAERYPELHILHLDAHTDLREEYLGARLSHASVMKRAWDILGDDRIWQFGIRSGTREEFRWAEKHAHLHKFGFQGLEAALVALRGVPVYFTIDLDVLDPSVFPGTGTPEAGGVTFDALRQVVDRVARLNIVGADIVELSPHYDASGASTAVALKVLRELLLGLERPYLQKPETV